MAIFDRLQNWLLEKFSTFNTDQTSALREQRYLQSLENDRSYVDTIVAFYKKAHLEDEADSQRYKQAVQKLYQSALHGSKTARNYLFQLAEITQDRFLEFAVAELLTDYRRPSRDRNRDRDSNLALMYYMRAAQPPLHNTKLHFEVSLIAKFKVAFSYACASKGFINNLIQPIVNSLPSIGDSPIGVLNDNIALRYAFAAIEQNEVLTQQLKEMPLQIHLIDGAAFKAGEFFENQAQAIALSLDKTNQAVDFFNKAVSYYKQVSSNCYLFEQARYKAAHILFYNLHSPNEAIELLKPLTIKGNRDALTLQYIFQRSQPKAISDIQAKDTTEIQSLDAEDFSPADLHEQFPQTQAIASVEDDEQGARDAYQARFDDENCIKIYQPNYRSITMPQVYFSGLSDEASDKAFDDRAATLATPSPFRNQLSAIVSQALANIRSKNQDKPIIKRRLAELQKLLDIMAHTIELPVKFPKEDGGEAEIKQQVEAARVGEAETKQQVEAARVGEAETKQQVEAARVGEAEPAPLAIPRKIIFDDDTVLLSTLKAMLAEHERLSYYKRWQGKLGFIVNARILVRQVESGAIGAHLYDQDLLKAIPEKFNAAILKQRTDLKIYQKQNKKLESGQAISESRAKVRELEITNSQLTQKVASQEETIHRIEQDREREAKEKFEHIQRLEKDKEQHEIAMQKLQEQRNKDKEQFDLRIQQQQDKFDVSMQKLQEKFDLSMQKQQEQHDKEKQKFELRIAQDSQRIEKLEEQVTQLTRSLAELTTKFVEPLESENRFLKKEVSQLNQTVALLKKKQPLEMPEDFYCPISREIMKDPVVAADGHTYDRASIEQWFKINYERGSITSPLTGQDLKSKELINNFSLKSRIQEYLTTLKRFPTPVPAAVPVLIPNSPSPAVSTTSPTPAAVPVTPLVTNSPVATTSSIPTPAAVSVAHLVSSSLIFASVPTAPITLPEPAVVRERGCSIM